MPSHLYPPLQESIKSDHRRLTTDVCLQMVRSFQQLPKVFLNLLIKYIQYDTTLPLLQKSNLTARQLYHVIQVTTRQPEWGSNLRLRRQCVSGQPDFVPQ